MAPLTSTAGSGPWTPASTRPPTTTSFVSDATPSSTTDDPYFTDYIYQEPLVTDGITSSTSTKLPGSVYDDWMPAMTAAIPSTASEGYANAMEFASAVDQDAHGKGPAKWFRSMPGNAQSVLVSFWIPCHTPGNIATSSAPASEYNQNFLADSQPRMLDLSHLNALALDHALEKSNKMSTAQKVAFGVSIPLAAVLVFLCVWLVIRTRAQRREQSDEEQTPASSRRKGRKSQVHKRDYNAEPLFPHKPLSRLSETSFSTEPGPSYGPMSKDAIGHGERSILDMPELPGSPTEETELLPELPSSSDDDFGTHFSGLKDPFSETATELPSTNPTRRVITTPGVSPLTYPRRDRLSHESESRRYAIDMISCGSPSRRSSVGERELKSLGRAFEDGMEEGKLGGSLERSKSWADVSVGTERHGFEEEAAHSAAG